MSVILPKPEADTVMMATACYYGMAGEEDKLDTFSKADYAVIDGEDGDCYVGHWLAGLGIHGVRFPKETTRPMNEDERARFADMVLTM
ncbi:MAG TPA: hypothetical protein VN256_13035 [Pyrinomonadaceae bacterium]|nr:hypothetical protein [Pyrinomonadaceae bacterium]